MYEELVKRLREQVKCNKKIYPQGVPFETLLLDLAADAIKELERKVPKHGEWENIDNVIFLCSQCKHASGRTPFCAWCGAEMKG